MTPSTKQPKQGQTEIAEALTLFYDTDDAYKTATKRISKTFIRTSNQMHLEEIDEVFQEDSGDAVTLTTQ